MQRDIHMRKLSDAILKGTKLIGYPDKHLQHGYTSYAPGGMQFDTLALAALGAGGPKEAGSLYKLMGTSMPDFIAGRINSLLSAEFPILFFRVGRNKLYSQAAKELLARPVSAFDSVFTIVASANDRGIAPTEIAKVLSGVGL